MNARNFFDSTNGTATTPLTASGKPVLFSGRQITTTNQSGGEDSSTLGQGGFVLGGPLTPARKNAFFFVAFEHTVQNATREGNFAVPTVEQRGLRGSGATGLANDPLTGLPLRNFHCARRHGNGLRLSRHRHGRCRF